MMRALYTAATGMQAQQRNIDTTANNLANVNTTGFKKSKVQFQDLLYYNERSAGVPSSVSTQVPVGIHEDMVLSTSALIRYIHRATWKTPVMTWI